MVAIINPRKATPSVSLRFTGGVFSAAIEEKIL